MARMKQEQRQQFLGETRQRLLEAAADEFARAGYASANINTISKAAGYAKGTIYNYFASKQALLLTLVDATALQHFEFIVERVRPEPEPARRMERFFQAGFEFVALYLPQSRVLFNSINAADEEVKLYVFQAYQPLFKFVAEEILALGIEQGIFRPVEPSSTALLLMTIYLGTASQLKPQGQPWLDPAQVAALVLNGLCN
jgi:AcrR family transcriptional regulator